MTDEHRLSDTTRRRYLKYAGVAVGGAGIGGYALFGMDGDDDADDGSSTPTETDGDPTTPDSTETPAETAADETSTEGVETDSEPDYPYSDRFENVVDVAAAGGDTGGEEPINGIIEDGLADNTLFYFPEGTYYVADLLVVQHYDNVGFVGPDATLRPTDGQIGDWIIAEDVSEFLFEGFSLSNEADHTAVRTKLHVAGGENVVRDVEIVGFQDVATRTHGFTLQVNGADTTLLMDGVELTDGARNGTGMFVHPSPEPGTLRLEECQIANWYEQGLYGSSHGGPMYVEGGRYANNGKAQLRAGGGAADTEAIIRNVTVRITDPQPAEDKGNVWGIWLHEGVGTVVENCDIEVTKLSKHGSSGALVLGPEQGETTIRDTTITVDDSTFALTAASPKSEGFVIPSMDSPPENWSVTAENLEITGEADGDVGVWVVDRPGSTFRDVSIDQSGDDRDGIGLLRSPGAEITGLSCRTSGYPVVADADNGDRDCVAALSEVERVESTRYGSGEATETETVTESGDTTESSVSTDATPVAREGGEYCLDATQFDVTENRPVLGVTQRVDEAMLVELLSEQALNPY